MFAWCVAIGGFVVYLVKLDSFMDAYGASAPASCC